uniref:PDZ and LIM domain protein 7 n=1 Tax=Cacopsylla melanoneura TaxID=428564 RepID=A0A8D9EK92_9HEMI
MTSRVILLEGGPPWGFRMTSGAENSNIPLKISRVNPGSKAAQKGIREGDIITSINGQPSMKLNPTDAQKLLKQAGANLKLGLNENGANKKSDTRTKPKTEGQIETAKTENQSEPKEKESSGPEDKEEEFATVKKKEFNCYQTPHPPQSPR